METLQIFSKQIRITQDLLLDKLNKLQNGTVSNRDSKFINEGLVAINKVLNCNFLQVHDRILLEKTYRYSSDLVHNDLWYFCNYFYFYQDISKNDIRKQQTAFIKINANTATMLTTILGFNRHICSIGGSTDDYFVERAPMVFKAFEYILREALSDIYLPALYALINLCQTLTEYLFSKDEQYKDAVYKILTNTASVLDRFINVQEVQHLLSNNLQLYLFYLMQKQRSRQALGKEVKPPTLLLQSMPNIKTEHKLRVLSSLFHLDHGLFIKFFEAELTALNNDIDRSAHGLNNFLFLQCLAYYFTLNPTTTLFEPNLKPLNVEEINVVDNLRTIFNNYEHSHSQGISPEELDLLLSYNDETLREKIANIIVGVDRVILQRECKKPHGGFEISDMELPIKLNDKNYFLCMPFKSGIEIKSPTVPEGISYQIFRPFINFDRTIVIFITAKRCSQNLMNCIKKMQDKLGWGIAVIENEELAKLLKINGQLN